MAFKTIVVQLDVDAIAAPCVSFAWDLAQRHEADLIAFCAAEGRFVIPSGADDRAAAQAMWRQLEEIEGRLLAGRDWQSDEATCAQCTRR